MYQGLLAASGMFIFVNNITIKYNRDKICGEDLESLGIDSNGILRTFPQHYCFTLLNLVSYAAAIICVSGLGATFQRKKLSFIHRKLKNI